MPVIDATRVSKCFTIHPDRPRSFQDLVVNAFKRQPPHARKETFWALRDLSFSVEAGETLGIIGSNGSGKSTCLKLLTRIIEPTTGKVNVKGRISALLELGAGFHPELTGRENVFLNGSVLGLKRREMAQRLDDIVAFAELERFIDMPVKFYSSGMYVRLAFAVAIHVRPDVLLVDEVLAVGDQSFQTRCLDRIDALKTSGVTIVLVSHGLEAVRNVCKRTIWLDQGVLKEDGLSESVVARYLQWVHGKEEAAALAAREVERRTAQAARPPSSSSQASPAEVAPAPAGQEAVGHQPKRFGSREAEITEVMLLDAEGRDRLMLTLGEPMSIVMRYRAHQRVDQPMFGFAIHRNDGLHVCGPNNVFAQSNIAFIEGDGEMRFTVDRLPLLAGTYYLTVALHDHTGTHTYDHHDMSYRFRVQQGNLNDRYGVVYLPGHWEHCPAAVPTPEAPQS
jgi:ABC-type polysaccharide/polyol phosphate transport system ATPase subunit